MWDVNYLTSSSRYAETEMQRRPASLSSRTRACMRYCGLTNYFCLHMGAAGSNPPGISPSSCTAHVSWHQAHEHEASNTHSHIHSCVAEVSTLLWLSDRSSVAPHGVTCTMAAILGTNLHVSMCIYCLAGLCVWSHYFLFPFLLAKHAAECAVWMGLLELLKFLQNLIITRLQYWPRFYRKNNILI